MTVEKQLILNDNNKTYYFAGIGGVNMSALANILHNKGYNVAGSDIRESNITKDLENKGITVNYSQVKENIKDDYVIVRNNAISDTNEEIIEAQRKNLNIIERAELLDYLSKDNKRSTAIAISGTHGKTSTTSILSHLMIKLNMDPTCLVGGEIQTWGCTYRVGEGNYFVYEACEAFNNFQYYTPTHLIVTSIDVDHTDVFKNLDEIKSYFVEYINRVASSGIVILNGDDENIISIRNRLKGNIKYYSVLSNNKQNQDYDYTTVKYSTVSNNGKVYSAFDTILDGSSYSYEIPLTGVYNIQNSLSAIALLYEIIPDRSNFSERINSAFYDFINAKRRFEYVGCYKGASVYTDFSHHPKEISLMLDNASNYRISKSSKIISVFQPHLYSRTKEFYKEFSSSLSKSDIVIITPIYPAREEPIVGVSSEMIYNELIKLKPQESVYIVPELLSSIGVINNVINKEDLLILIGAGDIGNLHKTLTPNPSPKGRGEIKI